MTPYPSQTCARGTTRGYSSRSRGLRTAPLSTATFPAREFHANEFELEKLLGCHLPAPDVSTRKLERSVSQLMCYKLRRHVRPFLHRRQAWKLYVKHTTNPRRGDTLFSELLVESAHGRPTDTPNKEISSLCCDTLSLRIVLTTAHATASKCAAGNGQHSMPTTSTPKPLPLAMDAAVYAASPTYYSSLTIKRHAALGKYKHNVRLAS